MAATKRYGMTPDGRMTECHAKNPDTCPYHAPGSHKELSQREVDRVNELATRAVQASATPGLKKIGADVKPKQEYLDLINDLVTKSQDVYNGAQIAMMKIESDFRDPVKDVRKVLPTDFGSKPAGMSDSEWTADVSNKELSYLMDDKTEDLTGRTLLQGESKLIGDELSSYARRNGIDRRTNGGFSNEPTPAEERALEILMDNPLAEDDEVVKGLVNDPAVMEFGARYAINSPYLSDTTKTQAFNTAPENAIESQSLDGTLVNKAVSDEGLSHGSKTTRHKILHSAMHHPHVDPDLAYKTMKQIQGSDEWTPAQKNGFDWQLAMNPNQEVAKRIAELDKHSPESEKLTITKNWEAEHKPNK